MKLKISFWKMVYLGVVILTKYVLIVLKCFLLLSLMPLTHTLLLNWILYFVATRSADFHQLHECQTVCQNAECILYMQACCMWCYHCYWSVSALYWWVPGLYKERGEERGEKHQLGILYFITMFINFQKIVWHRQIVCHEFLCEMYCKRSAASSKK